MKIPSQLLAILLILSFATVGPLEQANAANDDPYPSVYAKRQMKRLDKDGNGKFEAAEDQRQWKAKKRFDSNSDGALTLDELLKCPIRYLDCPGEKKLNVLYKSTPQEELYLDIYYPTDRAKAKLPTVFYTHGGGWAAGSKQGIANGLHNKLYLGLLEEGFCVVAINYRLWAKGESVSMRDCVVDCKDAVRYLSKHSDELGVDTQRFFVQGDSAGGHLAQMLLLSTPDSLPGDPELAGNDYNMIAGVSWYGPCDFEKTELFNHDGRANFRDRFGPRILKPDSKPEDKLSLYREMSPVNLLRGDGPPLLMIQGDQDTTIPVHHAHYMKDRAEKAGAPVETMIIKNAGHNWRDVGSAISPGRGEIVKRSVDFLTSHLDQAASIPASSSNKPTSSSSMPRSTSRMPEFSWDTLPLYIHVRKSAAFTAEETKYLAEFPLITFEKTTGSKKFGSTDSGTIRAAEAVKQINPSAKVLFYRNVFVHYGSYSFDDQLDGITGSFVVDKKGNDKVVRGHFKGYDLSSEPLRKWWVDSMASVTNHQAIDGVFLDGNVKVLSTYLKRQLPDGKKAAINDGFHKMMRASREAIDDDKLMIANILRARFDDGGLEFIDAFDGSYLEAFEHAVRGTAKADYIAKGIATVQKAATQGKIIALTLGIGESSLGNGIDETRGKQKQKSSINQERIDYCIALFLVMAERYSYLNIHDGYDVNPTRGGGNNSQLWLRDFPEFKKPLGPPKGPAVRQGYQYTREFEHASVWLDIEAGKGKVTWK